MSECNSGVSVSSDWRTGTAGCEILDLRGSDTDHTAASAAALSTTCEREEQPPAATPQQTGTLPARMPALPLVATATGSARLGLSDSESRPVARVDVDRHQRRVTITLTESASAQVGKIDGLKWRDPLHRRWLQSDSHATAA